MRSICFTPRKALCIAAMGLVASGFVLGVALAAGEYEKEQFYVEAYNSNNLIRFHVIANSDSINDQALKRRIRDMVVQYMTPKFELAQNVDDARDIALNHLTDMEQLAQKEIERWGEGYKAKAVLGRFTFPEKTYGKITLPEGEYEAVRIILGEGAGANWWCVLFPPLCFVTGSKEMPVETLPEEISNDSDTIKTMSVQDTVYEQVPAGRIQDTEIRVRFKIVELLDKVF